MFDIGFSELLLVGLVALVVLGPERLPGAVRTAGLWVGRIKRSFNSIKAEVEREIGADEIRRQLHNENILALERQQQAASPPAPPGDSSVPTAGETAAPAAPTPAQANAPIAANSRLNALPAQQAAAQTPASGEASPSAVQPAGQPATPSEPPRPT